jgi:nucleosome binding factor SPN SPT16 subunit
MNTKEAYIIDQKMHIYICYASFLVSITLHNRTKNFVSSIVDLFSQIDRLSHGQQRKEKKRKENFKVLGFRGLLSERMTHG